MIKGRLAAKASQGTVNVYFMQRGNPGEDPNLPVKVYRRQADDINFTSGMCGDAPGNWTEYIDNQKMEDPRVSVVFEGALSFKNSFCTYYDSDVEYGHTYIYWVTQDLPDGTMRIGPVACKLRDPEIWWSYERGTAEMQKLCNDYPELVKMETFGESTEHRKMNALQIGNPDKKLMIFGAVHASEPGFELILKALRNILELHPDLLTKIGIGAMPAVNVDVREQTVLGEPFYLRKNPNGVDLNRNFDWLWKEEYVYGYSNADPDSTTYHGPFAASENETQAAMRFAQSCKNPVAFFVYDSASVTTEDWLLFGSNPTEACWEYDNKIANIYSQAFRADHPDCGTFTAPPMHYPKELMECFDGTGQPHGTLEGWAHSIYGVPSYSAQSAGSEEAAGHDYDNVPLDILNKWARRHAYALIAIMEEMLN